MKDKNKKVTVIIISILIVLILLLALTYAYFSTKLSGTDQIVKVGELELVLDETSEGINLANEVGISDSKGLSLEGSTFDLINSGERAVDYIIYLDDNSISDTDTRMDDKYLKYNLNKNGSDSGATLLTRAGTNPSRVIDYGTIEGNTTNKYKLNLWITDEVDGNYSGQVFSGKLRVEVSQERETIAETLLANVSVENLYDDGTDTFITGEDPNNYIWYSGKLWRAVSVNNSTKTTKLVTQWNISTLNYSSGSTNFAGSHLEEWLNDETKDGFLGNLRSPNAFIVIDSLWDATEDNRDLGSLTKPNGTTVVTNPVGLLNMYEYQASNSGRTDGYLNNGLNFWTLTPYDASVIRIVDSESGGSFNYPFQHTIGVRPSINLKSNIKIAGGKGTEEDPYRLYGDNDTNLSGTLLNTRYSGEYVKFGNEENSLYRIVSHESLGLTKITSAYPLKSSGTFITSAFGDGSIFSETTIGSFLNGEYLTNYVDSSYTEMIEDSTTWYLGTVGSGSSYKLVKYVDTNMSSLTDSITNAKVGLLRYGELMAGQFDSYSNGTMYWIITPNPKGYRARVNNFGGLYFSIPTEIYGIRPALNLKSNVKIVSGKGTKLDPFILS